MNNTEYVASLTADKCDPNLGAKVKEHLVSLGLETAIDDSKTLGPIYSPKAAHEALRQGIYQGFKLLGLDVDNDASIQDTPNRFAKMFVGELTKGLNYDFFPKMTVVPNGVRETLYDTGKIHAYTEKGAYDQMVLVANIQTVSLCEHHLQTIDGFTHVAYIPGKNVLGLSKFARVVEFFAARPQIQERFTEQVFAALSFVLETEDIGVVCKAKHFCMHARGAKQHNAITTTDKMSGRFLSNSTLRKEFLDAIAG